MADVLDRKLRKFEKDMAKRWSAMSRAFDRQCELEFKARKLPALFDKVGEDAENYLYDTLESIRDNEFC